MKKIVLSVVGLLLSASSFACGVDLSVSDRVREILSEVSPPLSDEKCEFLNKRGLAIKVSSFSKVFEDGSVTAFAFVELIDSKTNINSYTGSSSSGINLCVVKNLCPEIKGNLRLVLLPELAKGLEIDQIKNAIIGLDLLKASAEIDAIKAKNKPKK